MNALVKSVTFPQMRWPITGPRAIQPETRVIAMPLPVKHAERGDVSNRTLHRSKPAAKPTRPLSPRPANHIARTSKSGASSSGGA